MRLESRGPRTSASPSRLAEESFPLATIVPMAIEVGSRATWQRRVEPEMAASHWGNEGVEVLATPTLVGLFEATAVRAIKEQLAPGESTVGTVVNIRHLKATPVGDTVTLTAEVAEVDGRRVVFRVRGEDSEGLIGEGTHERFVVDLERFMAKVNSIQPTPLPPPSLAEA